MSGIASIFYFEWSVFFGIIYQNLKHFSFRRLLFVIVFILVIGLFQIIMLIMRLIDEILFIGYRGTQIKEPVFIISSPRSGTTYLHNLYCMDEERFSYFLLYHTFFPSILFYRFIRILKWLDSRMNWYWRRFWERVEGKVFKGWDGVHPMGFEKAEEDEGLFVLQMMSPAVGLFCPPGSQNSTSFTSPII